MKKSLFIFFLSISFFVQGQEVFPDSVQTNYDKAVYYNALAEEHSIVDSSLIFFEKASNYTKKCDCDSLKLKTYFNKSFYASQVKQYNLSIKYLSELDSVNKMINDDFYSYKMNNQLGYIYLYTDSGEKALKYFNKAY